MRGRDLVFDQKQADEFIACALKFLSENMRITEVAQHLGVSTITIYRSNSTGLVRTIPIDPPQFLNRKLWWSREAVERCARALEKVI